MARRPSVSRTLANAQNAEESTPCTLSRKIKPDSRGTRPGMTWRGLSTKRATALRVASTQLDPAFLIHLGPALRLVAEILVELFRRGGHREDAGLFQPVGHAGVGHGAAHIALNLLHHRGWRSGRRDQPDPTRHLVDLQPRGF